MANICVTSLVIARCMLTAAAADTAQATTGPPEQEPAVHEHSEATSSGWMLMHDGALFLTFNRQGGDRGLSEFKAQNWWMTMATHRLGPGQVTFKGMFTAEPLTVTPRGYSQLFQMGEAYNGLENIDYQHPHELIAQLAAVWRVPLRGSIGLTISGAPVGEATLGPVAFMHRQSASENPTAPLAHHTLDSTHISEGVVAARIDRSAWAIEASAFHGREPDQFRYSPKPGALDSWATRIWFGPSPAWLAQVSYGFLKQPEQLEPGDVRKATASISWIHGGSNSLAVTAAVGRNWRIFDTNTTAFLSEALLGRGGNAAYARIEVLQVTTEHLMFPTVLHRPHPGEFVDVLGAFTGGFVRRVPAPEALEIGLGADVTFYNVPKRLVASAQYTMYGAHPVSVHVFLRIRPRPSAMGRLWNMVMSGPTRPAGMH